MSKSNTIVAPTVLATVDKTLAEMVADGVRTVYLLDYDGVLAPYRDTSAKGYFWTDNSRRVPNPDFVKDVRAPKHLREPRSYPDCFSTELAGELSALLAAPDAVAIFVTTWRGNAPVDGFNLNPSRDVLYLPWGDSGSDKRHDRKVGAVAEFLAAPHGCDDLKLVWCDDIVLSSNPVIRGGGDPVSVPDYMFRNFGNDEGRVMLVAPSSNHGLSRAEVAGIKAFVAGTGS